MARIRKPAAAIAVAAAFSLLVAPAAAVELPVPAHAQVHDGDAENAQRHGRDWDDDDWDIDAEDVVVGAVVIGALAAIFGAANSSRHNRYPEQEPYPEDAGYDAPLPDDYAGGSISAAVDACVREIDGSGARVGSVSAANRDGDGWYVSGELEDGSAYWCRLDAYGTVSEVGGSGIGYAEPVEQYDDDYYSEAREQGLQKLELQGAGG